MALMKAGLNPPLLLKDLSPTPPRETMTLLIDADWLLYAACCACENEIRWDEWIHTLHSEPVDVQDFIGSKVNGWKKLTGDDQIVMCLSDYPSFRSELYQDYKANRVGKRKPLVLKATREWIHTRYTTRTLPGLEGDDVLGLLMTGSQYPDPIMVAIDKDMRTVPGRLLVDNELVVTTEQEANMNWMLQTLTGDVSDNYPGIKGCGPKTAAKVLDGAKNLPEMWALVVAAYKKAGLGFADALLNARLARILRDGDYNEDTNAVRLWEPNQMISHG